MPSDLNVSSARSRWLTERANRSKRQTTTASKRRRCASANKPVQLRPLLLRPRDADVHVLAGDGPAAALAVLPKLPRLHRGVLTIIRCASHARKWLLSFEFLQEGDGPGVPKQSRPVHAFPSTTLPVPAMPPRNWRCAGCLHSRARGCILSDESPESPRRQCRREVTFSTTPNAA